LASPPQSEAPALAPAEPTVAVPTPSAEPSAVPAKTQVPEPGQSSKIRKT